MPACQPGRHSSCWLCLMSRWLLYSVMIPDPWSHLNTANKFTLATLSSRGHLCDPRIGQGVSLSPVWGYSVWFRNTKYFHRARSLCHEVYVVITGFPDPRAGNEKRALLGAKYFKDKSLQWIFSAKYLSISDKNKFLFTEPFAWQSSPSLSQTTSPLLVSDAGIPGLPAQWKLFDTNFQWLE